MIRLITAEIMKLAKRRMTANLAFILMGLLAVFYMILYAISKVNLGSAGQAHENLLGLPVAIPFSLTLLSSIGALLSIILAGSSIGNEYGWRTIRTMLICSESRSRLLGAKLIAVVAMVFVGMLVGVATGFVMSLITTALGHYSFSFSFLTSSYLWQQFLQFWRTFFVILPYLLLAYLFGVVGRSAMAGIALGIGVLFLEPVVTALMRLTSDWIASVPDYLIASNVRAIAALNKLPGNVGGGMFGGANGQAVLPGAWHASAVLALYCLLFVVLAFYTFRQRDVTTS